MRVLWYRLACWFVIFFGIAAFANWPRDIGKGQAFLVRAGFPYAFALWKDGELEHFSGKSLTSDLVIWIAVLVVIPVLLSLRQSATSVS